MQMPRGVPATVAVNNATNAGLLAVRMLDVANDNLLSRCGVLTVEVEHVDVDTLEKLEKQGVYCQLKASTVRVIRDKYQQKVHFSRHGIPLPEFMKIDILKMLRKQGNSLDILL
ncbi:hypothetical protein VNO80_15234 [Phaseolus coccineus]|uniref:phosphoribosylaminoimidazole carboxylase n=1 Tax=Phaseolus coccineus TaxID=3886 RepID=A0AAN9R2S6_PHACN